MWYAHVVVAFAVGDFDDDGDDVIAVAEHLSAVAHTCLPHKPTYAGRLGYRNTDVLIFELSAQRRFAIFITLSKLTFFGTAEMAQWFSRLAGELADR